MHRFLDTVPTLKHLHIESTQTTNHSFDILLHMIRYKPECTDNTLPNLETLEVSDVQFPYNHTRHAELVLDCLESRWWIEGNCSHIQPGLVRLEEVEMRWTVIQVPRPLRPIRKGTARAGDIERAERLRDEGMILTYPILLEDDTT
jgi:hypothetical protein